MGAVDTRLGTEGDHAGSWDAVRRRDRDLVKGCLQGDEDSWTQLWLLYGPLVKATARRAGLGDDDVGEVLQRTAVVALERLSSLREPEKLAGWLAGIARYQVLAIRRSSRSSYELDESLTDEGADFTADLERDQEVARLYSGLASLDPRCRRLLARLDLKDPPDSYQDVAGDESLAPTSIGPIRRRCLNRLKKAVERLSRLRS